MSHCNIAPMGYACRPYAESFAEFGDLIYLPRSGGYLLKRNIPGTSEFDAMGNYPLFFCEDWSLLSEDLAELPEEIVSVSIVADPFGKYTPADLEDCFDVVNPFKEHFIVDLERGTEAIGSDHHRKHAHQAMRDVQVEVCKDPAGFTDLWHELFLNLKRRHNIKGIRAFSKRAFEQQLALPEMIVHQAYLGNELVGAQLFYVQDNVAHCHLGAVNDTGYKIGAFYAMDVFSFEFFSGKARKIDLGGGAGVSGAEHDGLTRYKKGWSTETMPVYFCGRITNPERYAELVRAQDQGETKYFPAYRCGEFS